jgi:hypothetical protein
MRKVTQFRANSLPQVLRLVYEFKSVKRNDYPNGVMIQARALPIDPYYLSSTTTLKTLGVEAALITGDAGGSFSNPVGPAEMVTNLAGNSNSYFEWGRTYFKTPGDDNSLKESSLDYKGSNFRNIETGTRF